MKLTSPAFEDGGVIPKKYTCLGSNISPPLEFKDMPADAKYLALIVEDVDASPVPWVHWLVFNIPASTGQVPEGQIPKAGTEGYANGGTPGYEGPCPKYFKGIHRYQSRLLALDERLNLPESADKAQLLAEAAGHILAEHLLTGLSRGLLT